MATFVLIRHGATDLIGKRIAGRMPGIHLNALGKRQAADLAERLGSLGVEAIYSGPLERARETAAPSCEKLGLTCAVAAEFDELNFGQWTNCTFAELETDPLWKRFNSQRGTTAPPEGEAMQNVQERAMGKLEQLRLQHRSAAIVTHCDVIRAIITHCLGMPLDFLLRIEIDPGSISLLELNDWGPQLRLLNADCSGHTRGGSSASR